MNSEFENESFDRMVLGWYRRGMEELGKGDVKGASIYCDWLYGAYRAMHLANIHAQSEWYVEMLEGELSDYIRSYFEKGLPVDYAGSMYQSSESDEAEGF